jgi:tRNA G46 methylase TrmB
MVIVETNDAIALNDGEQQDDENDDFVMRSLQMESFHDDEELSSPAQPPRRPKPPKSRYNSKKPKWWIQQSRKPGRKIRQAIYALQDEYCLIRPPYGERLDWPSVFASSLLLLLPAGAPDEDEDSPTTRTTPPPHPTAAAAPPKEVWIEIGFGLGDNLLCLAHRFPHRYFLGSEVHQAGVGHVLQRIQTALATELPWSGYSLFDQCNNNNNNQKNNPDIDDHDQNKGTIMNANQGSSATAEEPTSCSQTNGGGTTAAEEPVVVVVLSYDNLRIYRQDITKLLPYIPDHTVQTILLTFPDPFPHGPEWRLLQVDVLHELHRVLLLDSGGRLYLATDHADHYEWCRLQIQEFNNNFSSSSNNTSDDDNNSSVPRTTKQKALFDLVVPTPDRTTWLPVVSKYERKGWEEGRETLLACWSATTATISCCDEKS